MSQKKKLVLSPLPEQSNDYSQYEETVTRWDRIIVVCVIFILIVGLMIAGGIYAFSENDTASQDQYDQSASELNQPISKPLTEHHNPVETIALAEPSAEEKPLAEQEPLTEQKLSAEKQTEITASAEKITPTNKASKDTNTPIQSTATLMNAKSTGNLPDLAKDNKLPKLDTSSKTAVMSAKAAQVNIKDSAISRAVLTQEIRNKEPVSMLPENVALPPEGIIKVMLFTEMQALRGQTLYHEWYHNNVRQARVKIPVNVDPQRSHSSKYINTQMTGDWRVNVVDKGGMSYVEAIFTVIKP